MYNLLLKIIAASENSVLRKENGFLFLLNKQPLKIKEGLVLEKLIPMPSTIVKALYTSIDQNNVNNIDPLIEKKISYLKKDNRFKEEDTLVKEDYYKFIKDLVPALYDIELINKNTNSKKINPSSLYDAVKTLIKHNVIVPYAYFKENMSPTIVLLRPSSKYDVSIEMLREACLNYSAEAYDKFAGKEQNNAINIDNLPDPGEALFIEGEYLPERLKFENGNLIGKFAELLEKKLNNLFSFKDYGDLYHPKIELSLVKQDFISYLAEEQPELATKLTRSYTIAANSLTSDTIPKIISQHRELILHYRAQSAALEKYGLIVLDSALAKNHQIDEEICKLEENIKIFKTGLTIDETKNKILGGQTISRVDELTAIIEQALAIKTLKLDQDDKLLAGLKNVLELKEQLEEIWLVIENELAEQEKQRLSQQLKNNPPKSLPEDQPKKTAKQESFFDKYYDLPAGIATFTVGITASGLLNFIAEAPLDTLLAITAAGTVVLPVLFKLLQKTNNIKNDKITGKKNDTTIQNNTAKPGSLLKTTTIKKNTPETLAIKEILYGTAFDAEPNIIVPENMIQNIIKNKMVPRLQTSSQFKNSSPAEIEKFIGSITTITDIPYHANGNIALPSKFKNNGPLKLFYIGTKLDHQTKQEIIDAYQNYFNERIPSDMKAFLEAHLKKLREYNGGK